MDQATYNKIISFIWSIADDVPCDVFVRGKYRDVIQHTQTGGGYRSPEETWPELQDAIIRDMDRLEKALRPHLKHLKPTT